MATACTIRRGLTPIGLLTLALLGACSDPGGLAPVASPDQPSLAVSSLLLPTDDRWDFVDLNTAPSYPGYVNYPHGATVCNGGLGCVAFSTSGPQNHKVLFKWQAPDGGNDSEKGVATCEPSGNVCNNDEIGGGNPRNPYALVIDLNGLAPDVELTGVILASVQTGETYKFDLCTTGTGGSCASEFTGIGGLVSVITIPVTQGSYEFVRVKAAVGDYLVLGITTKGPPPPLISSCLLGYPYTSANARTSVDFNESEVLAGFSLGGTGGNPTIEAFYSDEHALLLGVRGVGFPVTAMTPNVNPDHSTNPLVGIPNKTDDSGRPFFPALFITDITGVPDNVTHTSAAYRAGDWQYGGNPVKPNDIFGTWKGAEIGSVGKGRNGILTDDDPDKNGWDLGLGSDPVPVDLDGGKKKSAKKKANNQGYGTEVRWNINQLMLNNAPLVHGHTYRLQFMVHDGDQNKTGGDVGQACVNVFIP